MNRRDTPRMYIVEILNTSWRHGAELAVAAGGVVIVGLAALLTRSLLHLHAFSGTFVIVMLAALIAAAMTFVAGASTWRLYHRQQVALASMRSLLDLNARDRADVERRS